MSISVCDDCSSQVSQVAEECPQCGRVMPHGWLYLGLRVIAFGLIISFLNTHGLIR